MKAELTLPRLPPAQLERPQVFDVVAAIDRNPLGFHPLVVGVNFAPHFAFGLHRFGH